MVVVQRVLGRRLSAARVFTLTAAPNGAWPSATQAFYDPVAETSLIGFVDSDGDVKVAAFDHATDDTTLTTVGVLAGDQHNSPGLAMLPDGRYIASMSNHNGAAVYINVSTNPHDSTAWDGTVNVAAQLGITAATYTALFVMEGEGNDVLMFLRNIVGGVSRWCLSRSTDSGATWSNAGGGIASGTRWYGRAHKSTPTRLELVFTNGSYASDHADVLAGYYENGQYHDTSGTLINEPLTAANLTLVYDGATAGARFPNDVWGDGTDVAVTFPVQTGTPGAVIAEDGDYVQARSVAGAAWSNHTIAENVGMTTEDFTEGGVSMDPATPDRVAASIRVGGPWRMHFGLTANSGSTWSLDQKTFSGPDDRYPQWVRDYRPEFQVGWQHGEFIAEDDYNVGVQAWGIAV